MRLMSVCITIALCERHIYLFLTSGRANPAVSPSFHPNPPPPPTLPLCPHDTDRPGSSPKLIPSPTLTHQHHPSSTHTPHAPFYLLLQRQWCRLLLLRGRLDRLQQHEEEEEEQGEEGDGEVGPRHHRLRHDQWIRRWCCRWCVCLVWKGEWREGGVDAMKRSEGQASCQSKEVKMPPPHQLYSARTSPLIRISYSHLAQSAPPPSPPATPSNKHVGDRRRQAATSRIFCLHACSPGTSHI